MFAIALPALPTLIGMRDRRRTLEENHLTVTPSTPARQAKKPPDQQSLDFSPSWDHSPLPCCVRKSRFPHLIEVSTGVLSHVMSRIFLDEVLEHHFCAGGIAKSFVEVLSE